MIKRLIVEKVRIGRKEEMGENQELRGKEGGESADADRKDFNARTGELGGWWEGSEDRKEEERRKSKDKKENAEERLLLSKLEEIRGGLFLMNVERQIKRGNRHMQEGGELGLRLYCGKS